MVYVIETPRPIGELPAIEVHCFKNQRDPKKTICSVWVFENGNLAQRFTPLVARAAMPQEEALAIAVTFARNAGWDKVYFIHESLA